MSEWQPIETAPLDGIPRLIRVGPYVVSAMRRGIGRFGWTDMLGYGVNIEPTHWLPMDALPPLPAPPAEVKEDEQGT